MWRVGAAESDVHAEAAAPIAAATTRRWRRFVAATPVDARRVVTKRRPRWGWGGAMRVGRGMRVAGGVVVVGGLLAGCTGHTAVDQTNGGDTRYIAGGGPATYVSVGHRRDVASIHGTGLGGEAIDLATYRGSVVVLNVWASWCPPCRAESTYLVKAAADTKHLGVAFVGLLYKDSPANGRAFNRSHQVSYPSIVDHVGDIPARFRDLPPNAIPSTLVIDRTGRVAVRFSRPVLYSELVAAIEKVTAETA